MAVANAPADQGSILIVEDEPILVRLLEVRLQMEGYVTAVARTGGEALEMSLRTPPSLVLLDMNLPDITGFEVLSRLREHPRTQHLPVVALTCLADADSLSQAFARRVDDYITKPYDDAELVTRIRARMAPRESSLAPLTQLPGSQVIEKATRRLLVSEKPWALLYLDLDHFKAMNDAFGFYAGNEMIRLLARIADETVGEHGSDRDFVGHIGGEDFVIVTEPDRVDVLSQTLIRRWDAESRVCYPPEVVSRGTFLGFDRAHQPREFPLVTLSIAAINGQRGRFKSLEELSTAVARAKAAAKCHPGSCLYRDS